MIKGVDAQVMTNRSVEYSKDVSAMLRRSDINNEFADRLNRQDAEMAARAVVQTEKTEHARIRGDQEREKQQAGKKGGKKRPVRTRLQDVLDEDGLPAVGVSTEQKLLDIEI